jgi:hypothetical protein
MGKKNKKDDGRSICSLCFCKTGQKQEKLRLLPDGKIAEEECINAKIFKEVIVPVKKVAQLLSKEFKCLSLKNTPEELFESVAAGMKYIPVGKIEEPLKSMEKISQNIFGRPLQTFLDYQS